MRSKLTRIIWSGVCVAVLIVGNVMGDAVPTNAEFPFIGLFLIPSIMKWLCFPISIISDPLLNYMGSMKALSGKTFILIDAYWFVTFVLGYTQWFVVLPSALKRLDNFSQSSS
jgi:hypothetical protein